MLQTFYDRAWSNSAQLRVYRYLILMALHGIAIGSLAHTGQATGGEVRCCTSTLCEQYIGRFGSFLSSHGVTSVLMTDIHDFRAMHVS
jgi:hypothetical protein